MVVWVPADLMPAGPISRVHSAFAGNMGKAVEAAWGVFERARSSHPLHYIGRPEGPTKNPKPVNTANPQKGPKFEFLGTLVLTFF